MTTFTIPSDVPLEDEFDGLGRRRIIHPDFIGQENPKRVGYTRATTFIGALEDTTTLRKWRERLVLQGASEISLENEVMEAVQRQLNAEGDGSDPKQVEAAAKAFRKELDEIAERAFNFAGGHDAADYGTALHELADLWHGDDLDAEVVKETEERWPGITADFTAYQDAFGQLCERIGGSVVHREALLVNDRLKVSGRTDLVLLGKLPGDMKRRRIVFDIKTGKIDNTLKLSQQLAMYASSKLYDPATGIRADLRARQDVAIVAHVPRGKALAQFHLVDLAPGRTANALCERVRASRRKQKDIMRLMTEAEA